MPGPQCAAASETKTSCLQEWESCMSFVMWESCISFVMCARLNETTQIVPFVMCARLNESTQLVPRSVHTVCRQLDAQVIICYVCYHLLCVPE